MSKSDSNPRRSDHWSHDIVHVARGICMGIADVVPGVSGGTIALVLGIYHRLVTAISKFDGAFLRMLTDRQWLAMAQHVDLRFLLALGTGIAVGFVITVKTLTHYLEHDASRSYVLAVFTGLILAASCFVLKMILRLPRGQNTIHVPAIVVGLVIATLIALTTPTTTPTTPPLWYLFVCGAFAICAMILPGISGALILVLLGVYQHLLHTAREILHLENLPANLATAACFGLGCGLGLMVFSRILRRLLEQRPAATLSFLCGLMFGSLPLLWPFQVNKTPHIEDVKLRHYQPVWPDSFEMETWAQLLIIVVVAGAVFALEWWGLRLSRSRSQSEKKPTHET